MPLLITTTVFLEGNATEQRLEIVIHRWSAGPPPEAPEGQDSEPPEQPMDPEPGPQTFVISVARQPSFIQNISWIDGPEIVFEPDEVDKTVTLQFDTGAEGDTDQHEEEAELVLLIEAGDETIEPPEQELVIPLNFTRAPELEEPAVTICALKPDAPEDFPIEDAIDFCDPERVPVLKYDRIVVFFTPNRDLREPIGEAQSFNWRIVSPTEYSATGGSFWNQGTVEEPELTMEFTREGSPGRFAVEIDLWDARRRPGSGPGTDGPGHLHPADGGGQARAHGRVRPGRADADSRRRVPGRGHLRDRGTRAAVQGICRRAGREAGASLRRTAARGQRDLRRAPGRRHPGVHRPRCSMALARHGAGERG